MLGNFISNYTSNPYIIALIYLVVWFVVLRLSAYIIEKVILKFSINTKTDLDDIIIDKSALPLTWIVFFIGLKISFDKLPLSAEVLKYTNLALGSLIVIASLVLVYRVVHAAFIRVMRKVSKKTGVKHNEGLLQLTRSTLQIILVLAGIIYLLKIWGVAIGPLLTGLGIGGVAIALALQSSLGNVFGGVSIILDKSVNIGDMVTLADGTLGTIEKIGIRSTRVKTFDNEIVIVPNSTLSTSNIKNIAQPEPRSRTVIPFSVAYGSDVEKVKKIVLNEIKKIDGFINDPEPTVKFLEMGNSSLNFKAFFFVETYEKRFAAIDEANTRIYNALNKNKIEIPFPQMDIHMKK